jgi:hypothetical protein
VKFEPKNTSPLSIDARRRASIRALRLAAERAGLRITEYLEKVGLTREEFLAGKRPDNYGQERQGLRGIRKAP